MRTCMYNTDTPNAKYTDKMSSFLLHRHLSTNILLVCCFFCLHHRIRFVNVVFFASFFLCDVYLAGRDIMGKTKFLESTILFILHIFRDISDRLTYLRQILFGIISIERDSERGHRRTKKWTQMMLVAPFFVCLFHYYHYLEFNSIVSHHTRGSLHSFDNKNYYVRYLAFSLAGSLDFVCFSNFHAAYKSEPASHRIEPSHTVFECVLLPVQRVRSTNW